MSWPYAKLSSLAADLFYNFGQFVPARISPEAFAVFLALKDGPFQWEKELKRDALGGPIAGRKFDQA